MAVPSHPRVSVVIPTHNRAPLVLRAVNSALAQSFADHEVIVVDDAGTDDTQEVVEGIGDSRVRYLRRDVNGGPSAARNDGVRAASGGFVAFLDSDDVWALHKLERQMDLFDRQPEVDVVSTAWEWAYETGEVWRRRVPGQDGAIDSLPRWAYNTVPDLTLKRQVAVDNPWDEALPFYEVWDFLLRLAPRYRFAYLPEILVTCYSHKGPRASDYKAADQIRITTGLIEKYSAFMRTDRRGWAHFNFTLGHLCLRSLHQPRQARPYLWAAAMARPTSFKTWAYALASLLPSALVKRL